MRRRSVWLGIFVLILCVLAFCGSQLYQRAAAPLAKQQGRVAVSLSALPGDLYDAKLLAAGANPIVQKNGALYEVIENAYRRLELPEEFTAIPELIAPSPDGGLWVVADQLKGQQVLVKISLQGTVLVQQEVVENRVQSIACDIVGHVFLATDEGEVWRYSPEGVFQGSVELPCVEANLRLAVQKERVFVRACSGNQRGRYLEILPELSVREEGEGCLRGGEVCPIGSFLPEYALMEYDDVGLYACGSDGTWETVCLWEELHLDGTLQGKLCSNFQGHGVVKYEKNGTAYVLTLYEARK